MFLIALTIALSTPMVAVISSGKPIVLQKNIDMYFLEHPLGISMHIVDNQHISGGLVVNLSTRTLV